MPLAIGRLPKQSVLGALSALALIGTGLTFGLVGNMVTDGYVYEATFNAGESKPPVKLTYRHALHTTIGNASGPPG